MAFLVVKQLFSYGDRLILRTFSEKISSINYTFPIDKLPLYISYNKKQCTVCNLSHKTESCAVAIYILQNTKFDHVQSS